MLRLSPFLFASLLLACGGGAGEGKKAWVDVYVTPEHADAYRSSEGPMPEGMGMVKVAYEDAGGQPGEPANLTVMAKMAPGYDPEHGDWYYGVLSPDGARAMKQGKVEMCIGCHATAESDHVFGVPK